MEKNNTVESAYNDMLNIADSIATEGITEKSVKDMENMKDTVNQLFVTGEADNQPVSTVTTNNTDPMDVIVDNPQRDTEFINEEKVMTSYDPTSGEVKVVDGTEELAKKIAEKHLQNLQNGEESNIGADLVKEVLKSDEFLKDDENSQLAAIIARRMAGEDFDYYAESPKSFREQVDTIYIKLCMNSKRGVQVTSKKKLARMIIDDMINDLKKNTNTQVDLDTMLSGFDEDVKKMTEKMSTELGGMMMGFDDERKAEIDAAIKRCTEEGKLDSIKTLQDIRDTIDSGFNLTDFIEACKNIKIKNYDLKEPKRVYDYFNCKYTNSKMVINDIRSCPAILERHLTEYTHDQCMILCLAFCKYCQNMNPENIKDHTFMYYFIRNIIAIDRLNPKGRIYESLDERSKKFYDSFVANLKAALNNVLERNPKFK